MTNNPRKVVALEGYGLKIVERVPLVVEPNELNARYLDTKRRKMGHMLEGPNAERGTRTPRSPRGEAGVDAGNAE
jgi:hypothetical protein